MRKVHINTILLIIGLLYMSIGVFIASAPPTEPGGGGGGGGGSTNSPPSAYFNVIPGSSVIGNFLVSGGASDSSGLYYLKIMVDGSTAHYVYAYGATSKSLSMTYIIPSNWQPGSSHYVRIGAKDNQGLWGYTSPHYFTYDPILPPDAPSSVQIVEIRDLSYNEEGSIVFFDYTSNYPIADGKIDSYFYYEGENQYYETIVLDEIDIANKYKIINSFPYELMTYNLALRSKCSSVSSSCSGYSSYVYSDSYYSLDEKHNIGTLSNPAIFYGDINQDLRVLSFSIAQEFTSIWTSVDITGVETTYKKTDYGIFSISVGVEFVNNQYGPDYQIYITASFHGSDELVLADYNPGSQTGLITQAEFIDAPAESSITTDLDYGYIGGMVNSNGKTFIDDNRITISGTCSEPTHVSASEEMVGHLKTLETLAGGAVTVAEGLVTLGVLSSAPAWIAPVGTLVSVVGAVTTGYDFLTGLVTNPPLRGSDSGPNAMVRHEYRNPNWDLYPKEQGLYGSPTDGIPAFGAMEMYAGVSITTELVTNQETLLKISTEAPNSIIQFTPGTNRDYIRFSGTGPSVYLKLTEPDTI